MKDKKFNFLGNIFVILIVLVLVLYFSLKDDYYAIVDAISNMKVIWIIFAVIILILYRVASSVAHYLLIKQNHENISFWKCLQINFIILFFHEVTPFAGGGQPMEVYFLHKEGIDIPKATNITLQNFIVYQFSLVITGFFALIYNYFFNVFPSDRLIKKLVILGFCINLIILIFTYILSFGKRINKFILEKGIHFGYKLRIVRNEEKTQNNFKEYLDRFHQNALELKGIRRNVFVYVLINMFGLMCLYSMPFFIAKGLGCSISFFSAIAATAYVMIIGSFVPIPGGTGGIEYGFMFFYSYFISGSVLNAIMLVWRFISYYLGMIFGAIALAFYRKREKECE